ncbi:MAG: hypothetical protein QOC63_5535, partial [Mycobacterium sp.]|nr:hypothetical protein [Mycobacterium sp.]
THDLFVPNADPIYQAWSASAIELHRCDRQWCRVRRRIDLSAASLLPVDLLIRRHNPMTRPGTIRFLRPCRCEVPGSSTVVIVVVRIVVSSLRETAIPRVLTPGDPAPTLGCVKGGEAIT